jgi:hypothetical protein
MPDLSGNSLQTLSEYTCRAVEQMFGMSCENVVE